MKVRFSATDTVFTDESLVTRTCTRAQVRSGAITVSVIVSRRSCHLSPLNAARGSSARPLSRNREPAGTVSFASGSATEIARQISKVAASAAAGASARTNANAVAQPSATRAWTIVAALAVTHTVPSISFSRPSARLCA